jgi:sugar phosphate isomerase/epimerase
MHASTDTNIGDENIPIFRELGYDYIELPLAQTMELSDETFAGMLRRIESYGIPVEACNNFFPANLRLTGENAVPDNALEYARRATERAAQMGAGVIVLGSSGAKNIPRGFPYEKAKEQFLKLLLGLQNIVSPLGITIVLEPLNRTESNFILSVREGLAMVKEADCENIKLLADYYHMRMENEGTDALTEAGRSLCHVHLAAKEGRAFPKKNDGEDYAAFFAALKAVGYSARVSIEAYSKDIRADGAMTIALLKGGI